jgi:DNA polymerase-3 subunit beta
MKIEASYLLQSLKKLVNIVPKNPSLLICLNVHIKAEGTTLILETTDLGQKLSETLHLKEPVTEELDVAVNAALFKKALEGLDGVCSISRDTVNNKIIIQDHRKTIFELAMVDGEDFPRNFHEQDFRNKFEISAKDFKRLLNLTLFSVCEDDLKPNMCGILFEVSPEKLILTATDGHRLSNCIMKDDYMSKESFSFILDRDAAKNLMNILPNDYETIIEISENGKFLRFSFDNTVFSTLHKDVKFPEYRNVMCKSCKNYKVVIERTELLNKLKKIIAFVNKNTKVIRFSFLKNELVLTAEDAENSKTGVARLEVENKNKNEFMIGLNGQFVIDAMEHMENRTLVFCMQSPSHSIEIESAVYSDIEQTVLIMPISLL